MNVTRSRLKTNTLLIVAALTAVAVAGCSSRTSNHVDDSAYKKGRVEAAAAIASGTFMLKEYPALPYWPGHQVYVELLLTGYGVGYTVPKRPADVSADDFSEEVRGWNEVMVAAIEERHGAGVLDRLRDDAQQQWQSSIGARKES